jgi:two-component system KDP operon response regulator KdpE
MAVRHSASLWKWRKSEMSNNKYKILVVEDDRNILSMIQTVLETNGYQVLTAQRCQQGILMLTSHMPDLVVLDLGLPDMDGEEFIRITRHSSIIPIIVLSARSEEQDKVSALDLGANDYITKPFGTAELLARVRASLRINRMNLRSAIPDSVFTLDDLVIDYDRRQVSVAGKSIHVTQTEFNILSFLSQRCGKVMTYSAIISAIWGTMDEGSVKKLQVNMANIRKKLGCRPGENRYIINELGVGYRMLDQQD